MVNGRILAGNSMLQGGLQRRHMPVEEKLVAAAPMRGLVRQVSPPEYRWVRDILLVNVADGEDRGMAAILAQLIVL